MRVHLDCLKAGSPSRVKIVIPFNRQKDSAGYSVTTDMLGDQFTALSSCDISTTQVFFPAGVPFEIPTESMGREFCSTSSCLSDARMIPQLTTSTLACGKFVQYVSCIHLLRYNLTLLASSSGLVGAEDKAAGRSRARERSLTSCEE
jgi:hypothetical protein